MRYKFNSSVMPCLGKQPHKWSVGKCLVCSLDRKVRESALNKLWRKNHPEQPKKQYWKHRDKLLAIKRTSEAMQQRRKYVNRRYRTDPKFREKAIAAAVAYRVKYPERYQQKRKERYWKNPQKWRNRSLNWYYTHHELRIKQDAVRRKKNRHRHRAWSSDRSLKITDGYAREMLSKYSTISAHEWPQELVEVKRMELMCMRLTGDKRYKSLPETEERKIK